MTVKRLVILIVLASMLFTSSYSMAIASSNRLDSETQESETQENASRCHWIYVTRPGEKLGIWICLQI